MRKQPLIALGALVTLGASAIAGVSTGTFSSVPTSARTKLPPVQIVPRPVKHIVTQPVHLTAAAKLPPVPRHERDLVVVHDRTRPQYLRLSTLTGLPFVHHRHKPKRHVAPPATVVTQTPPTTQYVPPTTQAAPPPTTVPATAPSGGVWYELRMCESGDDYSINTGNGYYGAYQFALSTWLGLGFTGLPSDAPPAVQDRAAQELQARSGWGQWPTCSAKLGL